MPGKKAGGNITGAMQLAAARETKATAAANKAAGHLKRLETVSRKAQAAAVAKEQAAEATSAAAAGISHAVATAGGDQAPGAPRAAQAAAVDKEPAVAAQAAAVDKEPATGAAALASAPPPSTRLRARTALSARTWIGSRPLARRG
jgi:hypothetical protein